MIRNTGSKLMWIGRATVLLVGLVVILALVFGVASAAFGATGGNFILGQTNVATHITRLAGPDGVNGAMFEVQNNNAGADDTALSLKVQPGEAPMRVNSDEVVTNLNADQLDGKSDTDFYAAGTKVADSAHADFATNAQSAANADTVEGKHAGDIGVNGWEKVESATVRNADSPKSMMVSCPAGKVVVGTGYDIRGGYPGDGTAGVMVPRVIYTSASSVQVEAFEEDPTNLPWEMHVDLICAKAP